MLSRRSGRSAERLGRQLSANTERGAPRTDTPRAAVAEPAGKSTRAGCQLRRSPAHLVPGQLEAQLVHFDVGPALDRDVDEARMILDPGRTSVSSLQLRDRRPVLQREFSLAGALAALTPNGPAAAGYDVPPSTATTMRSRRSRDKLRPMAFRPPSPAGIPNQELRPCEATLIQVAREPLQGASKCSHPVRTGLDRPPVLFRIGTTIDQPLGAPSSPATLAASSGGTGRGPRRYRRQVCCFALEDGMDLPTYLLETDHTAAVSPPYGASRDQVVRAMQDQAVRHEQSSPPADNAVP